MVHTNVAEKIKTFYDQKCFPKILTFMGQNAEM
jgi:hypothetical protein